MPDEPVFAISVMNVLSHIFISHAIFLKFWGSITSFFFVIVIEIFTAFGCLILIGYELGASQSESPTR